jgi:hypothetical protein
MVILFLKYSDVSMVWQGTAMPRGSGLGGALDPCKNYYCIMDVLNLNEMTGIIVYEKRF